MDLPDLLVLKPGDYFPVLAVATRYCILEEKHINKKGGEK